MLKPRLANIEILNEREGTGGRGEARGEVRKNYTWVRFIIILMSKLLQSGNFSAKGSGRHTPKQMGAEEHIIHRSSKMVLMSLNPAEEKFRKEHEEALKGQGWNSAFNQPYKPYGDMEEVFEAFSAVKESLEQPIKQQETQLRIRMYKHMPQLSTKPPARTLAILNEHKDELR